MCPTFATCIAKLNSRFDSLGVAPSRPVNTLTLQFVCYDALVFPLAMPREPYSSLSVSHIYGPDGSSSHLLLGHDRTFVDNTEEAFAAAFEVVREFSRLRLPYKTWTLGKRQNCASEARHTSLRFHMLGRNSVPIRAAARACGIFAAAGSI